MRPIHSRVQILAWAVIPTFWAAGSVYLGAHLFMMLLWFLVFAFAFYLLMSGMNRRPPEPEPAFDDPDIDSAVSEVMVVNGRKVRGDVVAFEGVLRIPADAALDRLRGFMEGKDREVFVGKIGHGEVRLVSVPAAVLRQKQSASRFWLHGLLFVATFLTTTWAGALYQGVNLIAEPGRFAVGLPYSGGLLLILGAHELGHYFAARHHGMDVTLPFFIPVPFALGTFGAFIKMRSLPGDRTALFDVAIAGPLAGLVFAIPALAVGLTMSQISPAPPAGIVSGHLDLHSSVLLTLIGNFALHGETASGQTIILHPLAFAGWLGILLTAFNLLPIGQLDGGHLAHSLLGSDGAHKVSILAMTGLFLLAIFVWPALLFFALIVYLIAGTRDQPPQNDVTSVSMGRRVLGLATFVLLVMILMPLPHDFLQGLGLHCPYL